MKRKDIQELCEAGLITGEQRDKIVAHFDLKEDGGKFLAIASMIGAILVAAGITLLVAAHWDTIPRGVKISTGIALMLGAHGFGWWLREVNGQYRKSGEALHLAGSCLFLANIALLGQVYNLSSRPPNALLVWCVGIALLPWLLRSRAQFMLLLIAFVAWFGVEINEDDSLMHCSSQYQLLLYSMLGLVYVAAGSLMRRGAFAGFAPVAEGFGLFMTMACAYPMTWKDFYDHSFTENHRLWTLPVLAGAAVGMLVAARRNFAWMDRRWRVAWLCTVMGFVGLIGLIWFGVCKQEPIYMPAAGVFFVFCLLQIRTGVQERSSYLINLGIAFIALDIIAAYFDLFGSMAQTGLMFVVGGILLIVFAILLEKKRRKYMRQIKLQPGL